MLATYLINGLIFNYLEIYMDFYNFLMFGLAFFIVILLYGLVQAIDSVNQNLESIKHLIQLYGDRR